MSLLFKLFVKILDFKTADFANIFTGTFLAAPHLMEAAGLTPGEEALRNLLQGLVGIILMFITKWAQSYFQKKKNTAAPPVPLEPARPLKLNKPHNNEKNKEALDTQSSTEETHNQETQNH
jgi:hypothetical protein